MVLSMQANDVSLKRACFILDDDGDIVGVIPKIQDITELASYLRIKEAEINNKLTQAKCEAYELALTHTRPAELCGEAEK